MYEDILESKWTNCRVLIVSDSHGRNDRLIEVMEKVKPDLMLHLGDSEDDCDMIAAHADFPIVFVRGNCDYGNLPISEVISLGEHKAFITHGHYFGVRMGLEGLVAAAKEHDCDVAMYGHTHVPEITEDDGVSVYNPGSISLPRQDARIPTFILLDIDKDGQLHPTLNYLK